MVITFTISSVKSCNANSVSASSLNFYDIDGSVVQPYFISIDEPNSPAQETIDKLIDDDSGMYKQRFWIYFTFLRVVLPQNEGSLIFVFFFRTRLTRVVIVNMALIFLKYLFR